MPPDTKGIDHNGWHQAGGNVVTSIADYSGANKNKKIVIAQNLGDKGGSATYNPHDNSLTITDAKDQSAKNYVDYCNQPSGQFNNRWEETAAGLRGDSGVNSHNAACIRNSTLRFCNTVTGLCDTWKITETKNGEIKAIKKPKQKLADVEKMEEKAIQREEKKESQKKNSDKKSNQVSTKKSKQTQSTQSKKTTTNTTQPAPAPAVTVAGTAMPTISLPEKLPERSHFCLDFEFVRDLKAMGDKIYRCTECGREKSVDVKNGQTIDDVIADNKERQQLENQALQTAEQMIQITEKNVKKSGVTIKWSDAITDYHRDGK